jgi:hypothetical protein
MSTAQLVNRAHALCWDDVTVDADGITLRDID